MRKTEGIKTGFKDCWEKDCLTDALVLPAVEGEGLKPYGDINSLMKGLLQKVLLTGEFSGKDGQISVIHTSGAMKPLHILLVGLGEREKLSDERLRRAGGSCLSVLLKLGCRDIALSLRYFKFLECAVLPFVEGCLLSNYRFMRYKKMSEEQPVIKQLTLIGKPSRKLRSSLLWTETVASSVHLARDLTNAPANDMTPSALVRAARRITGPTLSVRVLTRKDLEKLGMGAFLSVAQGAKEPPKFIVLDYRSGKAGPPVALIGKSITFDSGGISIKPAEGMEKMKYDMAGGAIVVSVLKVAALMKLPLNIIGILPAAENLPGGSASRPGDIVRTFEGKTVEIISTDAEGRMTLADAIGYVKMYKPRVIIDIATLTGACSIAFGNEAIAMMGNDGETMDRLSKSGDEVHERVWQMPLFEEYQEYLKSDFADLKNSGGRTGSLVTAGYFLKEFAADTPWVHLDIAGMAWSEKDRPYNPKGATGVGVRLLLNYLREL